MGKTIGEKIREARKKAGLTQEDLARKTGFSAMTIRRVEGGFRNPTINTIKKVANTLGVSCECLFAQSDQNDTNIHGSVVEIPAGRKPNRSVMTLNDYQSLAARTINPNLETVQVAFHALHGMASEVGEIHGLYQKTYQGHEMKAGHVKKELGDLLWFIAEYCTALGWELEDVARENIEKLMQRYPEGFDAERSLHRKAGDI